MIFLGDPTFGGYVFLSVGDEWLFPYNFHVFLLPSTFTQPSLWKTSLLLVKQILFPTLGSLRFSGPTFHLTPFLR